MILAQQFKAYYGKTMSDDLLSRFSVYNSIEDLEHVPATLAPASIEKAFEKLFGNRPSVARDIGWNYTSDRGLRIPQARIVFLDTLKPGEKPSPSVRYYINGIWGTAREVVTVLEQLAQLD